MVGGLLGQNGGSLSHSQSSVRIRGADKCFYLGGLAGMLFTKGSLSDCRAAGSVSAGDKSNGIGGLVGHCSALDGRIANCWASGEVSSGEESNGVGGLVGSIMLGGTIKQCCASGCVRCGDRARNAGGLIGSFSGRTITDCYATGNVDGGPDALSLGGLVGSVSAMAGEITNCYALGRISSKNLERGIGGLIGEMRNHQWFRVNHSFWDVETTGVSLSAAGQGLTTSEMQSIKTYQTAGWGLAGDPTNGMDACWYFPPGGGYPRLIAFSDAYQPRTLRGTGTASDPYLIEQRRISPSSVVFARAIFD